MAFSRKPYYETIYLDLAILFFLLARRSRTVPPAANIAILKAEDARRYDKTLEDLLKSPNEQVRIRAALAAGRIGNDAAIPAHCRSAGKWFTERTRNGRIRPWRDRIDQSCRRDPEGAERTGGNTTGRECAHYRTPRRSRRKDRRRQSKGRKIKRTQRGDPESFDRRRIKTNNPKYRGHPPRPDRRITRAPAGAEEIVRKFLAFTDPNIVADALNTLARLRAKNANRDARDLLETHVHAIVRANAARVLGAAEDKEAVDLLIKAATTDTDSRVRVAAIRSLAALKDAKAAEPLSLTARNFVERYKAAKKPNFNPNEQNEFIEVATALGRILANTG